MVLTIDGIKISPLCGEPLKEIIKRAGLDDNDMMKRPLAAQIGGEVFNLNYDPLRIQDGKECFRSDIIKANGVISLLRYKDPQGLRVYERTMLFVFLLSARRHFPHARVCVRFALRGGLYIDIEKTPAFSSADCALLQDECKNIVKEDLPLIRQRLDINDAISFFKDDGQIDKVRLLNWRSFSYFDVYRQEDYMDYFYGEMAPSTGYANVFEISVLYPGLVLMLPDSENPNIPKQYIHSPKLASVFQESKDWSRLLHCQCVADLNDTTQNGSIRELIRISEALHEKSYARLSDRIVQRKIRAVMLSGPSSSGKTTSANRLYTQLRVLGKNPIMVSLDNYYLNRADMRAGDDGEIDLEHINTLDIDRFKNDLELLIAGEETEIPEYDFKLGRRKEKGITLQVGQDEPLIIEGIHGLNPTLLSDAIPKESIFKIYISALTTLNLDDHNRISTTQMRLLRRIVRDYETRGASVEKTLSAWPSVRKGEETWIFPYQEEADAFFNTILVYEPAILKKHIFPLLLSVGEDSPCYSQVRSLIKFLNYFADADVEDEIPPTSILREFIGGGAYFR